MPQQKKRPARSATRLPGLTVEDGYTRHPFDITNGVRTSGLVAGRHLKFGHPHDRHATAYYGVAPSVFHALLRRWQRSRSAAAIEETTFIDIGAGMGRALLLASELPFRSVLGIELNPTLVRIARHNLTAWRKSGRARAPLRLLEGDAAQFKFPAGPCLAFLFNPFGAPVMRRFLSHAAASFTSHPGRLDLIYVNNEQEAELERARGFRRLFIGRIPRSRADAIADHAILANQPDGEYASANHEDCSMWRWQG
ncbi:MAG TPA: class I SAM-dependent methyltransferase [Terracidiphilus sp.]|nr:class I SAM-dependent methyltransferase [Terracidiphilus sp.]